MGRGAYVTSPTFGDERYSQAARRGTRRAFLSAQNSVGYRWSTTYVVPFPLAMTPIVSMTSWGFRSGGGGQPGVVGWGGSLVRMQHAM